MTNNVNLVDEILSSIDEVESLTMESSVDVIGSMIDSYDKMFTIQENYIGDDIDDVLTSFYQEGQIMDEVKAKGANDGTIKKILMFIPRLLAAIVHTIKKAWNGGESTKKASSAVEKLKDAGSDVKTFIASVFSADSPEKIAGLVVGGITISAATAGIIFGIKKGIFDKIGNAIKAVIAKIKYFTHSKMVTGDVPTTVDESSIRYTASDDSWTLPVDFDAIVQCYTIPKSVIENLSRISAISSSSADVYKKYLDEFTKVRKLDILSKSGKTYTSDQLSAFNDKINGIVDEILETSDKAVTNINKLANNVKDDEKVDDKAKKYLNDLVSEVQQYAGIIRNVTDLVIAVNDSISRIDDMRAKIQSGDTTTGDSDAATRPATDADDPEQIKELKAKQRLSEAVKDVKSQIAAANESAEGGKASKEDVNKIFEAVASAHNVDVEDLKDAAKTPLKVKVSNAAAAGKEKATATLNAAANKTKSVAGNVKGKVGKFANSVIDKAKSLKKSKGENPQPTTEFDVEDINDVDVVMFEYFVALDEAEVVQESVSNGWYSR